MSAPSVARQAVTDQMPGASHSESRFIDTPKTTTKTGPGLDLILARHGQSHGNLDRSLGPDTSLTDLGREQARHLGSWLAGQECDFTTIYSSPLQRARQTAEIVNAHFGLGIVFDPDLRETELPYLDVLPVRQVALGGERQPRFEADYEQMRERVARATARILDAHPGESLAQVLVVAHAGTLGTMMRCILNSHALLVHTDLAAVHSLCWGNGRWVLKYANRQEYLPG